MANLLTNGDFEQNVPNPNGEGLVAVYNAGATGITGWVINGSVDSVPKSLWTPASGNYSLDLCGDGPGAVSQTFATEAGKKYTIKFSLAGNPGDGATNVGNNRIKSLTLRVAGTDTNYTFDTAGKSLSTMGWVIKSQVFTATSTSTTLSFGALNTDSYGPALDNVSVEPVVESTGPQENAADQDLDYSIQDQYAERGIYQLKTLPAKGKLTLNGVAMKVGDRYTQKDVNTGAFKYEVGSVDSTQSVIKDDFKFVILSGGQPVTSTTPKRSLCMPIPRIPIPSDGIYTFPINILVTPAPSVRANSGLTLYETQAKDITKVILEYGNDRSTAEQEIYTVNALPDAKLGTLTRNGAPVSVGDKFTQADVNAGQLRFAANENVSGATKLQFTVCNQVDKCTAGVFPITVKLFPSPVVRKRNQTINECDKDVVVTKSNLFADVDGGSDFPNATNEVTYVFDGCMPTYRTIPGRPAVPGTPAVPDRLAASVLKVRISGSILNDIMPKWRVEIDGNQVGDAEYVTTKLRSAEEFEEVTIQGQFGSNPNQVVIVYLNNDGASPNDVSTDYEHDRNLYVDYIDLNGKKVYGKDVCLESPGSWPNAPKYGGIYTNRSVPFVTGGAPPATIPGTPAVPEIPAIADRQEPIGSTLTVGRITISPCAFTQAELLAGNVKITDNCTNQPTTDCVNLPFTASWKNKSAKANFQVCFIPKPVITKPLPPDLTVVDSCLYQTTPSTDPTATANGFFAGTAALVANCGEFATFRGRNIPEEVPPGTIVYLPDAGPKTVMKMPDGSLVVFPMTKEAPPPPTEPPTVDTSASQLPQTFASSDDGTKYIKNSAGQIVPIAGTAPEGAAPNIDGFAVKQDHITQVDSVDQAPATAKKILVTPLNLVMGLDAKTKPYPVWLAEGNVDYGPFFWTGPNEFYVGPGQAFNIDIYGHRGFVKITPGGSLDGEHFNKSASGSYNNTYYGGEQGISSSGVQKGIKSGSDGAGKFQWGGEAVSSTFFILQGSVPCVFDRAFVNLDDYVQIGTDANGKGYGGACNSYPAPYQSTSNSFPAIKDRKQDNPTPQGVPYYVYWHFNGAAYRLNGATTGEAKAWKHATIRSPTRSGYSGPSPKIDISTPQSGVWEFPLTATDLITGQQISRTYKVHFTPTGRSPAGRAAETTDLLGMAAQAAQIAPGSLVCKITYGGTRPEGGCAKK